LVSFVGAASPVTSCGVISTNGTYVLSNDLTGASQPVGSFKVCIGIQASNVVFDCNGHNVTNDGTTGLTAGIIASGEGYQNITIQNCPSVSGYQYGAGLDDVTYSVIRNVTGHHNRDAGIYIARRGTSGGDYNLITNCTAYYNGRGSPLPPQYTKDGFYMHSGSNNVFSDNVAYDNFYGFHILSGASSTNLTDNTAYLNNVGTYAAASNNVWITGDHYYDNTADFSASGSGVAVSLAGVVFDNPAGDFKNYTNLSLSDVVSSAYSIDWGTEPASLPGDYVSFEDKFVDIAGGAPIDSVTWHWLQDETLGYAESTLGVWKHNGTWSDTGATLDAGSNKLTLTNLNPASTYAVLGKGCPVIDTPGTYVLEYDLTGEPNAFSYFAAREWACVLIESDDVVFDCNGHTITNIDNTDYGVVALRSSNVEIKNCDVSGYGAAVSLLASNESIVRNNTIHENYLGIQVDEGHTNLLTNNTIQDNLAGGIGVAESPYTNTTYNVIHNNSDFGISLFYAPNNTVMGNNVSLHPGGDLGYGYGVASGYSPGSVFTNNTAYDNYINGFYITNSDGNILDGNYVYQSGNRNVLIEESSYVTVMNNRIDETKFYEGIGVYRSDNLLITNNNLTRNKGTQILISECNDSSVTSNRVNGSAYSNGGISVINSVNISSSDNEVFGSPGNGLFVQSSGGFPVHATFARDHVYGNARDFRVAANNGSVYLDEVIFDNPAGDYKNFTVLTLSDTFPVGFEIYNINWDSEPAPLQSGKMSFLDKFLEIAPQGTVLIDSATWHWWDNETGSYNESTFELWKYNASGWTNTGATLDTGAKTLSLSNFNPSSVFAILVTEDSDGDGVPDDEDDCPYTPGNPDWNGCPYADEVEGRLHIVDVAETGACPGPGNSCWVYLENVEVRVYNRSDPVFTAKWSAHPGTSDFPDIFTNDTGLVGSCTTNASGICTAGEVEPGEYFILGKYYDEAEGKTVYISAYKNPDDFVDGLATKDLQFMKQIKKNNQVDYKPVSQVYVEGGESAEPPGKGKKPAKIEEPSLGLTLAIFALLLVTALFVLKERR
jgi:parallel beta-helix repeat protein